MLPAAATELGRFMVLAAVGPPTAGTVGGYCFLKSSPAYASPTDAFHNFA